MTLMGICGRCAGEKPIHVPNERRRLTRGPDGEKLCSRHAREAWGNHDETVAANMEVGRDGGPRTDGGTAKAGKERTLNPETHFAADYKSLIYGRNAAIHFYLKDDKEWWVAHGPEDEPPGSLNGPWLFWTTYPSGPWELDFHTEEIATHHLDELHYVDADGNDEHSIHRARLVHYLVAPGFVQEAVNWDGRTVDTETEPTEDGGQP